MREDGKIDYIELRGGDLPATKSFYAAAFGWTFTDYGPAYAAFAAAGVDGGFNGDPSDQAAGPLVVLFATALDAMHATVLAAWRKTTRPISSFPGGPRFHFTHPPATP